MITLNYVISIVLLDNDRIYVQKYMHSKIFNLTLAKFYIKYN